MSPFNRPFKFPHNPVFKKPKIPKRMIFCARSKPEEDPIPIVGFHQATIWDNIRKPVNILIFK